MFLDRCLKDGRKRYSFEPGERFQFLGVVDLFEGSQNVCLVEMRRFDGESQPIL